MAMHYLSQRGPYKLSRAMKRAIVYHAHGPQKYAEAAHASAKTARKAMPDVDTVLITSISFQSRRFDKIIRVGDPGTVNAMFPPLTRLPREYDSAIYLDCITLVIAPMYDVFELVENPRTDMALTYTSGKPHDELFPSPGVPKLYPHWRSALVAFQNSDKVQGFFSDWWRAFVAQRDEHKYIRESVMYGDCHPDQDSMRIALYHSDLAVVTLRPRFCCPAGGVIIRGTARVLTGNGDMGGRARNVNKLAPERRLFNNGEVTRI